MNTDAIVVMDTGTNWPTWADEGSESNIAVLARHDGEASGEFECRAQGWLAEVLDIVQPRRGILLTSQHAGRWTRSVLAALARAVHAGGGRTVVLASSGNHAEQRHLAGLIRDLAQELDGEGVDVPLQLRVVAPSTPAVEALERVA